MASCLNEVDSMDNRMLAGAVAVAVVGGTVTYVVVRRRRHQDLVSLAQPTTHEVDTAQTMTAKPASVKKVSPRSSLLANLKPMASGASSHAIHYADEHRADLVDIVTLILTRNQEHPTPTDPKARKQAEMMVEQALAVLKMLTNQRETTTRKTVDGEARTTGAAPA